MLDPLVTHLLDNFAISFINSFMFQGVPDKQLAQSNIGHSWGYGNQITIFPTDFSYPAFQSMTILSQFNLILFLCNWKCLFILTASQVFKNTNLFSLIWETALCNPHVRKLANESCGTFMAIQNGVLAESPSKLMDLVKFSHQVCPSSNFHC